MKKIFLMYQRQRKLENWSGGCSVTLAQSLQRVWGSHTGECMSGDQANTVLRCMKLVVYSCFWCPFSSVRQSFLVNLISEKQLDLRIYELMMFIMFRRCQVERVCGDILVVIGHVELKASQCLRCTSVC